MSVGEVELFRRWVEAFNARDVEAVIAQSHPGIEVHSKFAEVDGAASVFSGHYGVRAWQRALDDAWAEFRIEVEAWFDLGVQTLGFAVLRGRGRRSGVEVTTPNAAVARWRDGLMSYLMSYASREEALRELGLTEDDLKPIAP